jgi:hypothetical protein
MDKALVLAKELKTLRERVNDLKAIPVPLDGKDGLQGLKGERGEQGERGPAGKNGKDGVGKDGKDGKDGKNGQDGVSVKDAYIAADGNLTIVLSDGKEIDAGSLNLFENNSQGLTVLKQTQDSAQLASLFVSKSFETTSKNLVSAGLTLNYTSGTLTSIVYTNGITKTFTYTSGVLTQITLSGSTPSGILLNKNLTYTSGTLSSISYN